jgi:hypothetical protein
MTSCLRCHDENKKGDLLGAFTYFTSTTFFNLADYSKRSTAYHDVLQLVTKVSTKQLANLIEANAKDATLWGVLQREPRPRTPEMSWFVRHDPPIQLELALASHGFVRPRLVSFIKQERATLEQTHRAKMIDAHPWTSAPERTVHKSN